MLAPPPLSTRSTPLEALKLRTHKRGREGKGDKRSVEKLAPEKKQTSPLPGTSSTTARRAVSWPVQFPYPFRFYCDSCGNGSSMLWCPNCRGTGLVWTKPGGAGVVLKMGKARCKVCGGQGVVACPACGGMEVDFPAPDPDHGPSIPATADSRLTDLDWLATL